MRGGSTGKSKEYRTTFHCGYKAYNPPTWIVDLRMRHIMNQQINIIKQTATFLQCRLHKVGPVAGGTLFISFVFSAAARSGSGPFWRIAEVRLGENLPHSASVSLRAPWRSPSFRVSTRPERGYQHAWGWPRGPVPGGEGLPGLLLFWVPGRPQVDPEGGEQEDIPRGLRSTRPRVDLEDGLIMTYIYIWRTSLLEGLVSR